MWFVWGEFHREWDIPGLSQAKGQGVKFREATAGIVSKAWGRADIAQTVFSWDFFRCWVSSRRSFVSACSLWSRVWIGNLKKPKITLTTISITWVLEGTSVFTEQGLTWGVTWKGANCGTWSLVLNVLASSVQWIELFCAAHKYFAKEVLISD